MERRVRIIWVLSLLTMTLLIANQGYWLYEQLRHNCNMQTEQLKSDCAAALEEELRMREDLPDSLLEASVKKDVFAVVITEGVEAEIVFYDDTIKRLGKLDNMQVTEAVRRYEACRKSPFQPQNFVRLMQERGDYRLSDIVCETDSICSIQPEFTVEGTLRPTVRVRYSVNAAEDSTVRFTVSLPLNGVLLSMWHRWMVGLLLLVVIAACLIYQIKTILYQRRIDRIRHEFLRSMMYELKQPKEDGSADDVQRLGNTEFIYSLNELRCGSQRTIITSRQAEILRLLAGHQGETVSREQILMEVWGDDSTSNSMSLNVQITHLRRALNPDPSVAITTVIKKGYMLQVK